MRKILLAIIVLRVQSFASASFLLENYTHTHVEWTSKFSSKREADAKR
jgi:hypothetical protein